MANDEKYMFDIDEIRKMYYSMLYEKKEVLEMMEDVPFGDPLHMEYHDDYQLLSSIVSKLKHMLSTNDVSV